MSEYQYCEFLAIDRPLTPAQVEEVGQHSSRAEITPTRFVNEYNYGNFRGDPYEFLSKYFDVMVHYANWPTRFARSGSGSRPSARPPSAPAGRRRRRANTSENWPH